MMELRARSVAAAVQRMRKAAGLVVADRVEIFYEVPQWRVSRHVRCHGG
jgi:hypothetical protein